MYKFIYFSGKELTWTAGYSLKDLKNIALRNSNVYQIVWNNRDQAVVWERECVEC